MQADSSFQEMMQRYNREIARMYERARQGPVPQAECFAADAAEPSAAEPSAMEPSAQEEPVNVGDVLPCPTDVTDTALQTVDVPSGETPVQDMTLSEALSVLMRYRTLDKAGRLSLARSLAVELAQIALEMCSGVIDLLCREDPDLDEGKT